MYSPDIAYDNFKNNKAKLIELNSKVLNEANTRFKIIDTLFVEILGWSKKELELEYSLGDKTSQGDHKNLYIDYLLESDQNMFLIEAKRNGSYFSLSSGHHRTYKLDGGFLTSDKDNKKFTDQAVQYMKKIGAPFCVLCNGLQLIIIRTKTIRSKRDVLVFKNIEDIDKNFIEFYNILSPLEVGANYLNDILDKDFTLRQPPIYSKKVFDSLVDRMEQRTNTAIKGVMDNYVNTYFGELTKSRDKIEILKECYVDPRGKYHQFSHHLKRKVRSSQIEELQYLSVSDKHKHWEIGNFEKKYITKLEDNDGSVFVLVGGVGAGKTTFIQYFYYHELDDKIRNNLVWIPLDFLTASDKSINIDDFIFKEISAFIKTENFEKYRVNKWETKLKIYEKDLEYFKEGLAPYILKDPLELEKAIYAKMKEFEANSYEHLVNIFRYLREELKQKICFIFDNTDQMVDEKQIQTLLSSFKWAKDFQATIVTSLRLENYFNIKDKPPFDAYQPNVFRIEPPSVKELLSKRLHVSKQHPQEHFVIDDIVIDNGSPKAIRIPIVKFVTILENTLNNSKDKSVEEMLESLSGGNMRRILDVFKKFIQSGNLMLYQNYSLIRKIQNVYLTYQEVLGSIALGDNKYYQSLDSHIKNLFSFNPNDGFNSHFINIYLLRYLETKAQSINQYNDGYVNIEYLYKKFECLFGSSEDLKQTLEFLLQNFIIESDIGERKSIVNTTSVAISELGVYYLNVFIRDWTYFKHIMIDTYIKNKKVHKEVHEKIEKSIKAKYKKAKSTHALDAVEAFLEYLKTSEDEDLTYIYNIYGDKYSDVLKPCMPDLIRDFKQSRGNELKKFAHRYQNNN